MGYCYMWNMANSRARPDRNNTSQKHNRKPANGRGEVLQGWEVTEWYDEGGGIEAWSRRRSLADSNGKTKDRPKKSPPVAWDAYIIHTGTKCSEIEDVAKFHEESLPERFRPKRLHLDLDFASNKEKGNNKSEQKQSNDSDGISNGNDDLSSAVTNNPQNKVVKLKLSLRKGVTNGANKILTDPPNQSNNPEHKVENKPVQNGKRNSTIIGDNTHSVLLRPSGESTNGEAQPSFSESGNESSQRNNHNAITLQDTLTSAYFSNGHRSSISSSHQENGKSASSKQIDKADTSSTIVISQPIKLCYSHSQTNLLASNPKSNSVLTNCGEGDLRTSKLLLSKSEDNIFKDVNNNNKQTEDSIILVASKRTSENGLGYPNKDAKSQYKRHLTLILNKVSLDTSSTIANRKSETPTDAVTETSETDKTDARTSSARSRVSTVQLELSDVSLKESSHNHVLYENGAQSTPGNGTVNKIKPVELLPVVQTGQQTNIVSRQHNQLPVRFKQLTVRNEVKLENGEVEVYDETLLLPPKDDSKMLRLSDTFQQFLGPPPFHPFQNKTPLQRARDNATKKICGLLQSNHSEGNNKNNHKRWASASSKMYPRTRMSAPSRVELKTPEVKQKSERIVTPGRLRRKASGPDHDPALEALEKAREKLHSNVWKRSSTSTLPPESAFISRH